jgi:hypothetical protein
MGVTIHCTDVSKAIEICSASGYGAYGFALISSSAGWSKRTVANIPSDCTTPNIASHWCESTVSDIHLALAVNCNTISFV